MTDYPIPDEVLIQHAAFLGKTRSGKTSSAKTAVERFVRAGERVCVLDPIKSDWWGMISSVDGTKPGLPFQILGGPHGHVPLPSSSGRVIGELVATGALPLSIIDMADFEAGGLQRFFCAFAESLMRHQRGVLHLVIEEAHEFAPKERAGIGDENMAIYWAKKLATAGGSKGVRLIVATQRVQALHNALLGSCETMVAHRLTAPADQKPVVDWLKANVEKGLASEIAGTLASLRTGSAWVCSGEAQLFSRVDFPRISTFDNSATPLSDDEAGKVKTAAVDVAALRSLVGEAVAEAEANDPKKLKAEVARLKAALEAKSDSQLPTDSATDDNRLSDDAVRAHPLFYRLEGERDDLLATVENLTADRDRYKAKAEDLDACVNAAIRALGVRHIDEVAAEIEDRRFHDSLQPARAPVPKAIEVREISPVRRPFPPEAKFEVVKPNGDGSKLGAERAPLAALAQVYPSGLTEPQWAASAGFKRSGGTWKTYRSRLRGAGLIAKHGDRWFATQAGAEQAGDVELPPRPGPKLVRWWAAKLSGVGPMAEALILAWPGWLTRDELAERIGMEPSGGTFKTYISRLAGPEMIERDRDRGVRLSGEMMGHG